MFSDRTQQMLNEITQVAALIKLNRLLDQVDGANDKLTEAFKAAEEKYAHIVKGTDADAMKAWRAELGEEMWATIATNPSLPEMFKEWKTALALKIIDEITDSVYAVLPDPKEITRGEVRKAILGVAKVISGE